MRRVVLVRPSGPRNVGSALRAVANFGPAELYAVTPELPSLLVHPEFEQMAHGVKDWEERCVVVPTLEEALADCTWTVGFTARSRDHRTIRDWRDVREEAAARGADPQERVGLMFGNETSGLSGKETERASVLVRVPTGDEHTSLNLALAASIALYDTFQPASPDVGSEGSTPISGHARAYLAEHVADTLSGAARSEHIRADVEASVRRLFGRAEVETRDARAWHAVMRALGNRSSPLDYGLGPVPDEPVSTGD
jgi:TrmH family RNA methyltransferase